MVTVSILIGNSDNRLTQQEWSEFVAAVGEAIGPLSSKLHFFGAPPSYALEQNACWVVEVQDGDFQSLKRTMTEIRARFAQESAALLRGQTEFV